MSTWIPVADGFLCDPRPGEGEVVIRDAVAYWSSAGAGEWVLDVTPAAVREAERRNNLTTPTTTRTRPTRAADQEDDRG